LAAQRPVEAKDLLRLREVSDPQLSPDGAWVAYTVSTADTVADQRDDDIWMSSWDGKRGVRITWTAEKEHTPRWSPDGRYLAFLSSRDDPREVDQVWALNRAGGEAERLTDMPGGVSDYAWSPDGKRLALIASDPDPEQRQPEQDSTERRPDPIVIDRYRFKYDEVGYIGQERDHLYVFTLAGRKAEIITPGDYDEEAPVWSPDGRSLAFLSRRRPEYDRTDNWDIYVVGAQTGAQPRQLTTFAGADMEAAHRAGARTGRRSSTSRAASPSCSTTAARRWRWSRPPAVPAGSSPRHSTGTRCLPPSHPMGNRCSSFWRTIGSITSPAYRSRAERWNGWSKGSGPSRISRSAGMAASR
jgi:dipeptidyl aminopeptidase/acylaminoacyl peptidase